MFIKGITENMETVWINKNHIVAITESGHNIKHEEYYYVKTLTDDHISYYIKKKDLDPILCSDSDALGALKKLMKKK